MHLPKWVFEALYALGFEAAKRAQPDWQDTPADQPHVNAKCYSYGLDPEDARFVGLADGVRSYRDVDALLNPTHEENSRWSGGAPLIMRRIDGDPNGLRVFEVVKYLLGEDRIRKATASIEIGSHEMVFKDAHGYPIVRFYAAGRKMHYGDAFRSRNAIEIVEYYFGKIGGVELDWVALPDMQHAYKLLVLVSGATCWMITEGELIPG